MRTYILFAMFLLVAGCSKTETQPPVAAQPEQVKRFDLKGLYPGLAKSELMKTLPSISCVPSLDILTQYNQARDEAKDVIAAIKDGTLDKHPEWTSDAKADAKALLNLEQNMSIRAQLYPKHIEAICAVSGEHSGLSFADHPAAFEIALKNDKVVYVMMQVENVKATDIGRAFAYKYNWMDMTQAELATIWPLMVELAKGIQDQQGATLFVVENALIPKNVDISLLAPDYVVIATEALTTQNKKQSGAGDL